MTTSKTTSRKAKSKFASLSTDARIMLIRLSERTGTCIQDFNHSWNRLGLTKHQAVLATNELVRAGLAKKDRKTGWGRGNDRVSVTWCWLTGAGAEARSAAGIDADEIDGPLLIAA